MEARSYRFGRLLLLGLAGCPQFQNDDWVVMIDDGSPRQAGDAANAPDAAVGAGHDGGAGDGAVGDAAGADVTSSDATPSDDAPPGFADAGPSGPDAGAPVESSAPDGAAAAQVLYGSLTSPRGIAVANGNVCWVGDVSPRGLFCAPAAGGGTVAHIDVSSDAPFLTDAFDLLFDAENVYWSSGGQNQVVSRPQSGGQPQQYFTGGGRVSFLAAGEGATFWATDFPDPSDPAAAGSGEVIVGPGPAGTSSNAVYTGQAGAAGVATYNGNVYWGTPEGIAFGAATGNTTIYRIPSPEVPVAGVAVDSMGVVYFLGGNQSLYRYVTGADTVSRVYGEAQPFGAGDVALDDHYVYVSEPDRGCIVRIGR
jgi:hypothetical protein